MSHTVATTHIQRLIRHALELAQSVHGASSIDSVEAPQHEHGIQTVESALEKAIADLRHAAEELEAERLSCAGWRQV